MMLARALRVHRRRTDRREPGFSLIEILISIAIAGVAFAVLTQTFANTLRVLISMRGDNDVQGDIRFVRNQILTEPDRKKFEQGGAIPTLEHGEAEWTAEVEPSTVPDLFMVDLESQLRPREGPAIEHTERLMLLRPTWSDAVDRTSLMEAFKRKVEDERGRDW